MANNKKIRCSFCGSVLRGLRKRLQHGRDCTERPPQKVKGIKLIGR